MTTRERRPDLTVVVRNSDESIDIDSWVAQYVQWILELRGISAPGSGRHVKMLRPGKQERDP